MAKFPLIGVSASIDAEETRHFVLRDYMRAIVDAGGIPVMMSPDMEGEAFDACLKRLDGLMLAGGNDIAPEMFGQWPMAGIGEVNPLRDRFEFRLVHQAVSIGLPALGICRGIQLMNAVLGGTLYQDLPTQYRMPNGEQGMRHSQTCPAHYASHSIAVVKNTLLSRVEKAEGFRVNSFHHQAVHELAPDLRVCATASDGVVEGIEHRTLPFYLGVQWHPERMYAQDGYAAALFSALVEAARRFERG